MLIDHIVKPGAIINQHELEMPLISKWLRSSYILLATNVADSIRDMTGGEFDAYRDLPNIAPSFGNMFIEWSERREGHNNVVHYGLLINSIDKATAQEAECWGREFGGVDARWSCNAFLFQFSADKDRALYLGHLFWGVGQHGEFVDHRQILQEYPEIKVGGIVKGMACTASAEWTASMEDQHHVDRESLGSHLFAVAKVPLMSLCFLHAKNVAVKKSEAPTVHQMRAWRKKDKPFFRYHTITIHGQATRAIGGHGGHTGAHHAVHICRGHFKRFTPEKPLLGKHVGIYWWPMMLRGSKEEGVVVKDYRIKPEV